MIQLTRSWTSLCLLTALQGLAIFLFASGFFLTRLELPNASPCDPLSLLKAINATNLWVGRRGGNHGEVAGCWGPRYYARVVVLLVDGLRYDFVAPTASTPPPPSTPRTEACNPKPKNSEDQNTVVNASKPPNSLPPLPLYLDRMPTVKALLDQDPTRARLAVFEADPPTTTSQRLKGLTTGGMPTFLDLRKNFNSPAVSEDSWINQLNAAAARAARDSNDSTDSSTQANHHKGSENSRRWGWDALLLGDDTWTSLYPNHFDAKASMPMSSFDTRDLHTVDDAVSSRLGPAVDAAMKQEGSGASPFAQDSDAAAANPVPPKGISPPISDSWAVLIAHFLGVDHVGHTHRADHPVMAAKLTQMDEILRSTVVRLEAVSLASTSLRHTTRRSSNSTSRNVIDSTDRCNMSAGKNTKNDEVTNPLDEGVYRTKEETNNDGPSLVLMFGDHGMTDAGNHGGATAAETHAGFFAWEVRPDPMKVHADAHLEFEDANSNKGHDSDSYNASRLLSTLRRHSSFASKTWNDADGWGDSCNTTSNADARRAILAQVDIVPSLSLLLGLPVPASSLGGVWPELFTLPAVQAKFQDHFYHTNCNASTPNLKSTYSFSSTASLNASVKDNISEARPLRVPWSQHPLSQALLVNAAQVWAYLFAYDAASMGFPEGVLAPLEQQLHVALDAHQRLAAAEAAYGEAEEKHGKLDKEEQTRANERAEKDAESLWLAYRAFLGAALALGRRLFTRFDGSLMASGLMILSAAVVAAVILLFRALYRLVVPSSVKSVQEIGQLSVAVTDISTSSLWFFSNLQPPITEIVAIAKSVIIPVGCCLLHTSGRFANSFVEREAVVLCFLNGTAALAIGLYLSAGEGVSHISKSTSGPFKPRFSAVVWGLVAAGAVRLTAPGVALRASSGFDPMLTDSSARVSCDADATEEIGSHSKHCLSQDSSTDGAPFLWLLWCSCGALVILSALCDNYLSDVGAATKGVMSKVDGAVGNNGETEVESRRQQYAQGRIRWAATMRKFAYFLLWFIVGCHWQLERDHALQTLAGESGDGSRWGTRLHHLLLQREVRLVLPRAVFALATLLAASVFSINHSANTAFEKGVTIVVWRLHRCALVGLAFLPFWTLLLGPSGPSCATALLIHAIAVLKLTAAFAASSLLATAHYSRAVAQAGGVICAAALCRLGARHTFHGSGHGNTFSDLQLGSAFVGFDNFWAPRAGFLLFINTVGAEVLWTANVLPAALAAVVLSTANSSQVPPFHVDRGPSSPAAAKTKAEIATAVAGSAAGTVAAASAVVEIGLYASAVLQAIDGLATVMAVAVHRRHLMVWAIFAPKLVLDAALHAAHASALLFSAWPCSISIDIKNN